MRITHRTLLVAGIVTVMLFWSVLSVQAQPSVTPSSGPQGTEFEVLTGNNNATCRLSTGGEFTGGSFKATADAPPGTVIVIDCGNFGSATFTVDSIHTSSLTIHLSSSEGAVGGTFEITTFMGGVSHHGAVCSVFGQENLVTPSTITVPAVEPGDYAVNCTSGNLVAPPVHYRVTESTPPESTPVPPGFCAVISNIPRGVSNVRETPNIESAIVGTIGRSQWYPSNNSVPDGAYFWYSVTLPDGVSGWVRSDVVERHGPCNDFPPECQSGTPIPTEVPKFIHDNLPCDELFPIIDAESIQIDIIADLVPNIEKYMADACPLLIYEFILILQRLYYEGGGGPDILRAINEHLASPATACAFAKVMVEQRGLPDDFPREHAIKAIAMACERSLTDVRYAEILAKLREYGITVEHVTADNACDLLKSLNQIGTITPEQRSMYDYLLLNCGISDPAQAFQLVVRGISVGLPIAQLVTDAQQSNDTQSFCDQFISGLPQTSPSIISGLEACPDKALLLINHNPPDETITKLLSSIDPCRSVEIYLNTGYIAIINPPPTVTPTPPTITLTFTNTAPSTPTATSTATDTAIATSTAVPCDQTQSCGGQPSATHTPTSTATATATNTATNTAPSTATIAATLTPTKDTSGIPSIAVFLGKTVSETLYNLWVLRAGNVETVYTAQAKIAYPALDASGKNVVYYEGSEADGSLRLMYASLDSFKPLVMLDNTSAGMPAGMRLKATPITWIPTSQDRAAITLIDENGVAYPYTFDIYDALSGIGSPNHTKKLEPLLDTNMSGEAAVFASNSRYFAFVRDGTVQDSKGEIYVRGVGAGKREHLISEPGRECLLPTFGSTQTTVLYLCMNGNQNYTLYRYSKLGNTVVQDGIVCGDEYLSNSARFSSIRAFITICNVDHLITGRDADVEFFPRGEYRALYPLIPPDLLVLHFQWIQLPQDIGTAQ